jgi:transcriptional regulator with XRE-family HTH domain
MKSIYQPAYRAAVAFLAQLRRSQGLTQQEVAIELGVTRTWVSKVESCELRLDLYMAWKLCRLLGVSLNDLENEIRRALE